jgi:hypothetical protein
MLLVFTSVSFCYAVGRWWSDDVRFGIYAKNDQDYGNKLYLLCYFAFVAMFILLLFCRDGTFSVWHIVGSTYLHNTLFSKVLKVSILSLNDCIQDTNYSSTLAAYMSVASPCLELPRTQLHHRKVQTCASEGKEIM